MDEILTSCEAIEPLLAAYALGEHDDRTRIVVDDHIQGCAACLRTLEAYRSIAQLLPLSAASAEPAADLRERVTAAVAAASNAAAPPRVWRWPTLRAPLVRRLAVGLLVAALLAWNIALHLSLAAEQQARQQQTEVLTALLRDPQLQRRILQAGVPAPDARGTISLIPGQPTAALAVESLPLLPSDRVYQLWLVSKGQRISGGTFTPDASGRGTLIISAPHPIDSYDTVGVTVEPTGGSPKPTSPRVIGGRIL